MANSRSADRRVAREKKRILALLADFYIQENKVKILEPIVENVAWMKVKLDDARAVIAGSNIVIPYDNGGGQNGIRENPAFKGYEALWKSYMAGLEKILEELPEEERASAAEVADAPKTVLELVRERHKKEA